MSATLAGVGAVSSAMTYRPACRAWFSAALTALPFSVIRIPLSPRDIALSIALICVWVSPSEVPAATVSFTPSFAAAALASLSIDTKYGLLSVLRTSVTPTEDDDEVELPAALPHADTPNAVAASAVRASAVRGACLSFTDCAFRSGAARVLDGAVAGQRCLDGPR